MVEIFVQLHYGAFIVFFVMIFMQSLTPSDHFNSGNIRNHDLTSREKSMLRNLMHLSQQKFFDLLGTHIDMALLYSAAIPCISTHP
jgi:hypothetical protein